MPRWARRSLSWCRSADPRPGSRTRDRTQAISSTNRPRPVRIAAAAAPVYLLWRCIGLGGRRFLAVRVCLRTAASGPRVPMPPSPPPPIYACSCRLCGRRVVRGRSCSNRGCKIRARAPAGSGVESVLRRQRASTAAYSISHRPTAAATARRLCCCQSGGAQRRCIAAEYQYSRASDVWTRLSDRQNDTDWSIWFDLRLNGSGRALSRFDRKHPAGGALRGRSEASSASASSVMETCALLNRAPAADASRRFVADVVVAAASAGRARVRFPFDIAVTLSTE